MDYVDYMLNQKYSAEEKFEKAEELFANDMDDIQGAINKLVEEAKSIAKYYEDEYGYIFYTDDYLTL